MNNEQLKSNVTSSKHWFRLVFMLLFAAVLHIASLIMWVLVGVQFLFSLLTGEDNSHLRKFGHSLSTYIYEVLKFLCYSSDEKPFPFADWPVSTHDEKSNVMTASPTAEPEVKKLTDAPDTADN